MGTNLGVFVPIWLVLPKCESTNLGWSSLFFLRFELAVLLAIRARYSSCDFRQHEIREQKMRTNLFSTNFLNTPKGPGHPSKILGTSQIPLFETQGRQTFEGGHELFGHHPFAWKTPAPPAGLRTQKVNLCVPFYPVWALSGRKAAAGKIGPASGHAPAFLSFSDFGSLGKKVKSMPFWGL